MALVSLSSQFVLHPVVSQNLRLISTTLGREKACRAAQNLARILAYVLLLRGHTKSAQRWAALQVHLALARKLLQLGKPLEHLQNALRAQQTPAEPGERLSSILRQLSYAGYMTLDALVWANSIRFLDFSPPTAQRLNRTANKLWLAGILLSITHGLMKAGRLANEVKRLRKGGYADKDIGAESERQTQARVLNSQRVATRSQFMMDCIDVWLPASALGYVGVPDGLVGLCGLITSVMSLQQQWDGLKTKKA